jgi:ribosome biogenesis SPOUT family RNA methylase Rps3
MYKLLTERMTCKKERHEGSQEITKDGASRQLIRAALPQKLDAKEEKEMKKLSMQLNKSCSCSE